MIKDKYAVSFIENNEPIEYGGNEYYLNEGARALLLFKDNFKLKKTKEKRKVKGLKVVE